MSDLDLESDLESDLQISPMSEDFLSCQNGAAGLCLLSSYRGLCKTLSVRWNTSLKVDKAHDVRAVSRHHFMNVHKLSPQKRLVDFLDTVAVLALT